MDESLPPLEEPTGIDTYTRWVFRKWLFVLSSGGVALAVLIWGTIGFTITNLLILTPLYTLYFAVLVYVATYKLWEAERDHKLRFVGHVKEKTASIEKLLLEKDDLESEVRQLHLVLLQREQDRKPRLIGSASHIQIEPVFDVLGMELLGSRILIFLGISNVSTVPTTISEFKLNVSNDEDLHFLGYAGDDLSKFGFLQRNCIWPDRSDLKNEENLADRFSSGRKAELGERHSGWLFFDFELIQNPNEQFDWSNNTTLHLTDAFDERHLIEGGLLKKYSSDLNVKSA
jgi:hypothetical protein